METKTYFAGSLPAAMDVARRELGPDAMLVTSRPAPEDAKAFGRLEVTFAWEADKNKAGAGELHAVEALSRAAMGPRREVPGSALEDIRLEISALRAAIARQTSGQAPGGTQGATSVTGERAPEADIFAAQALCETGVSMDTARQIVLAAVQGGGGRAGEGVLRTLAARIPTATFTPLEANESRTLAFVGPPGRGKTTSLIKVAVRCGLARHIPTRIYSAGAHGVGGTEQMARYASILGVPFQAFESFESLGLALQGERWNGLVLIDTPGAIAGDRKEMEGMAKFFARRSDIEKHLVIRAEARSADMQYMLTKFAAIGPSRLLFTGVDEVRGLGAAADTMIRSGLPATFFGTGTQIPEDLEEVNVAKLARSLWMVNGLAARAA
jgi:flagellar biosynthesis protein FlhF